MSEFDKWFEKEGDKNHVYKCEKWIAEKGFIAGQQSQQAKIDELQARIDEALKEIESGITGKHHIHYIAKILKGNKDENY